MQINKQGKGYTARLVIISQRVFAVFMYRNAATIACLLGSLLWPVSLAAKLAFPGETFDTRTPADVSWDASTLAEAIAYAEANRSTALVISKDGRLVVEKYWDVTPDKLVSAFRLMQYDSLEGGQVLEDVASVQKSVIAILALKAQESGELDLDAPATQYLGEGWSRAQPNQESTITVRHIMSMTSGLSPKMEFVAPPETFWQYNTPVYALMTDVLEAATGHDIDELTREWITGPIGMRDTQWRYRKWSMFAPGANSSALVTTARDLTRLGILMLGEGTWDGETVVGDTRPLTEPSQAQNPQYALLWWLNRGEADDPDKLMVPSAPREMFAARGMLRRDLFVLPTHNITVVRMGNEPEAGFDEMLWSHLSKAFQLENRSR